jgi:hypothetical protein
MSPKPTYKHMGFVLTRRNYRLDFKVPADKWTEKHEAALIEHGGRLMTALLEAEKASLDVASIKGRAGAVGPTEVRQTT